MPSSLHQSKTNAAHAVTSFNSNANKRPKYFLLLLLPFFAILAQAPFVAVGGKLFFFFNYNLTPYVQVPTHQR